MTSKRSGPKGILRGLIFFFLPLAVCHAHPFRRDIAQDGNEAYASGDYSEAVTSYLKAQDIDPLSADLHFNLGTAYYRLEEYGKALEEFNLATKADDPLRSAAAFYNLGNTRYRMAKRDFQAGIAAGSPHVENVQSPVQEYVKKLEECIRDYEEALKRNPDDEDAKYNLELIRREIKNLMRRNPNRQQNQQQQQQEEQQKDRQNQQQQDPKNRQDDSQQQENQPQEQERNQTGEEQQNRSESRPEESATPTPRQAAVAATPTPNDGKKNRSSADAQPEGEPTQLPSISAEMARNLLDNLPEQRPRRKPRQRRSVDKDW